MRGKIREKSEEHLTRLHDIAMNGEHKDSVAALKLLWSYAYGAPHQTVSGEDGAPIQLDASALIASLRKQAGEQ